MTNWPGCLNWNLVPHLWQNRSDRQRTPEDADRRVGDLGNVKADAEGRASFKFVDRLVDVNDIIGRSVVIAEGADDLGKGSTQMSKVDLQAQGGDIL